jgi:hypothetical protein
MAYVRLFWLKSGQVGEGGLSGVGKVYLLVLYKLAYLTLFTSERWGHSYM